MYHGRRSWLVDDPFSRTPTDRDGKDFDANVSRSAEILAKRRHLMGFDPEVTRTHDPLGRPHSLLPYGETVREMLT
ncbi:MAG: hypothetical protein MK538_12345 [Planctomycetes bacterium]|nr:hypothetical protein [Planctomycetota bacterium]